MIILAMMSLVSALVLVDFIIKTGIETQVAKGEEYKICNDKITIRKVYNKGFALNAMDDDPEKVKIVSLYVTVIVTIYQLLCLLLQRGRTLKKVGLSLMTAGAWSNTIDRWLRGYVIDYFGFNVKKEKIRKITFNLADMFIFIGGIILVSVSIFKKK